MVHRRLLLLARLGVCALPALSAGAQQPAAVSLCGVLPDEVLIALEVAAPEAAVRELLAAAGSMPAGLPPEVLAPVGLGLTAASIAIGGDPAAWAGRLFGGGAAIGFLPAPAGARSVVVARPGDLEAARTWCERYAAGKFAIHGELLLMGAEPKDLDLLQQRTSAPPGRWATADLGPPRAVRGAVDLAALRALPGVAKASLEGLGGAQRFFGAPLVHALASASWLRFSLAGGDALTFTAEADASVRGTKFGELLPGTGPALPPLPSGGLLSLCVDRSVRKLLAEPSRFLPPADVLAVQGFLSIADAVDGVRTSFVADLLGGLHEPFVLHVVPPVVEDGDPRSLVVLPGIALVAAVADPGVEAILNRTAQVLMTITNAERMQKGQAPYQLRAQKSERGHGLVAEPLPWRGPGRPPIDSTLSPTLWFEAGCVAFASTRAAAEAVLAPAAAPAVQGDRLVLRGPALAVALAQNRGVIELARLLDEGEGRDDARRFVDVALAVAAAVRETSIRMHADDAATRLVIALERER